jgi:hypothetical protein
LLHYAQGGRRRWAVAGLALALAGMWVRWHSFLVVWLLALPVWGCLLNTQRRWSSLVWPLGLIALLQIHRSAEANWYQQHFHHDVWAYQQAVDVIVSNPNHIDSLDLVQHQLTPADYALMQQWSGIDRERHSESVWLSLADGESGWRSPAEAIKRLAVLLWQEWYYCWALLPLMVLLIRAATRLGRARSWAICLGLIVAGLCGYGLVFFRLPHRLFYPMLVTALIFLFFLVKISSEAQIDFFYHFYKNKIKTLYTAAFLTAFPIALQLWYSNGQNALTQQAFAAQYAFTQAHPNKVFIVGGGAMPIEALCQWRNPALHSAHNLIPTGWPIHTPAYQAILQYHHIENPIDALLETPAPMLIGLPLGPLSLYFEQHHATPILFDTIAQWPGLIVQPNIEQ